MAEFDLRPVADDDASALVALVDAAYREYPGCVLDLPGVDADLTQPATTAARRGGRWWVVLDGGEVVASVGSGGLAADGAVELKRLYVAASHRRQGLARRLVARVQGHAEGLGATRLELWSDTRFADAHALYHALGFTHTGETRALHDPSDTTEYRFTTPLTPADPRRTVQWDGPNGLDTCHLVDLPDGTCLRGELAGVRYHVEVDAGWRSRVAAVVDHRGTRRLTTDGAGRWWLDGAAADRLRGCLDVDIEATPATNALPIRRLHLTGPDVTMRTAEVSAVWLRVPGPRVERAVQHYDRLHADRLRYRQGGFAAELRVDEDGLPITYGDLWQAR